MEDSNGVSSSRAEYSVVRVPEAELVVDPTNTDAAIARAVQEARQQTQADTEAVIARAVQEAREEARQAVFEELLHQERHEESQVVVQTQRLRGRGGPPATEEEKPTFRLPTFIRKHAFISCAMCSILLLGAVGAGVRVAFSSSTSSGNSGSNNSDSVPSSPSSSVEPPPTPPSPLSFLEPSSVPSLNPTVDPTPQPTKTPTPQTTKKPTSMRPTPHPTPLPTQRPTAAPSFMTTAPPIPSTVVGITSWTRVGSTLPGADTGDVFGSSDTLALSSDGTILAVGDKFDGDVAYRSGSVQVYQRVGGQQAVTWQPMGEALKGVTERNWFGSSVALSFNGQILVVGANEYGADRPGYVRVFAYDNTNNKVGSTGFYTRGSCCR